MPQPAKVYLKCKLAGITDSSLHACQRYLQMAEIKAAVDPNMLKFGTTVLNEQTEPPPFNICRFLHPFTLATDRG